LKEQYEPQAQKLFKKLGTTWQNVWVAGGWAEMNRTFNADGYGLTWWTVRGSSGASTSAAMSWPNAPARSRRPSGRNNVPAQLS
jgi:hypothetical protein